MPYWPKAKPKNWKAFSRKSKRRKSKRSKKKTTPNPILISIMNLWVNRIQGQLTVLAVALFFFSCEDEASRLGYPNPNSKFDLKTIDIPVSSSILLLDSIRTSNYDAVNDVNRFLVGRYNDSRFGDIASATFAELLPADTLEIDTLNNNGVIT